MALFIHSSSLKYFWPVITEEALRIELRKILPQTVKQNKKQKHMAPFYHGGNNLMSCFLLAAVVCAASEMKGKRESRVSLSSMLCRQITCRLLNWHLLVYSGPRINLFTQGILPVVYGATTTASRHNSHWSRG